MKRSMAKTNGTKKIRLSKERKAELLDRYPTGESVGRAVIEYFLSERSRGPEAREAPLTISEMEFLRGALRQDQDKIAYNKYVGLHQVIVRATDVVTLFEQTYYHGFFWTFLAVQGAGAGLSIVHSLWERHSPELKGLYGEGEELCDSYLSSVEKGLMLMWGDLVDRSLRILHHYNFVLSLIGEYCRLDFGVILPKLERHETEIRTLMEIAAKAKEAMASCKRKGAGNEEIIGAAPGALRALKSLSKYDAASAGVNERTKRRILEALPDLEHTDQRSAEYALGLCSLVRG